MPCFSRPAHRRVRPAASPAPQEMLSLAWRRESIFNCIPRGSGSTMPKSPAPAEVRFSALTSRSWAHLLRSAQGREPSLLMWGGNFRFWSTAVAEGGATNVSEGRLARLQRSPREGLVSGRKPQFHCKHEIALTAHNIWPKCAACDVKRKAQVASESGYLSDCSP
jgi:hypothetical protein